MPESRNLNMIVAKPGGNAGKNSLGYRLSIPSTWAQRIGVTLEDRSLIVTLDGDKIIIQKSQGN